MATDPVEQASRDGEIYEVTGWEPRTKVDRLAVVLYTLLRYGTKGAVFAAGVLLTLVIAATTTLDLVVADPFVTALVALSIVPALGLAAYVRLADVTTPEPLAVLSVTFLLGVVFAGFAALLNQAGDQLLAPVAGTTGQAVGTVLFYFLVVGPVEESVKLLATRLYAYNHDSFDAVIDGAVYGAAAGLGFATIENALYITGVIGGAGGVTAVGIWDVGEVTVARTAAGPGHILYSAIAGYYLGLAKFNPDRWGQIVTKGLLVAALFHAFYNATVGIGAGLIAFFTPLPGIWAAVAYIVLYLLVVGYYLYRKLDRYRRAYRTHDAGRSAPGPPSQTEFEPGQRRE